ncbi:class I SAM-dependent methyltransferase family protein [archaeon]|nr:class I SAM-dependent methyltransferase family protein [archaeon]
MVKHVKTKKKDAEKAKKKILEASAFDTRYQLQKDKNFIYFPVKKDVDGLKLVDKRGVKQSKKVTSLKEVLIKHLTKTEMAELVSSFDIIGDIAIIEIPPLLEQKKTLIGQALLEAHSNIHSVFQKKSGREGVYRTIPLELIAGENRFETIYLEHGVRLKLDVSKVYFSVRLSEERKRIASLVENGEHIAGLFAGVGPFPLVIAKTKQCKIYAVELNPIAVNYMKQNIILNQKKLKGQIVPIQGDAREIVKTIPKCDRVLMPLPKGAADFLDSAINVCKPNGIIHFYQFAKDDSLYEDATKKILNAAKKAGRKATIINKKVVRPYSPRMSQVVLDFKIT